MRLFVEETDITTAYDIENISPKGEMLFFDIETTGLKKETTQIYMIGCGYFNGAGNFEIRQWMTESAADEREVLEAFLDFAKDFSVLMHFNGDGFDIPYVEYKTEYYGMGPAFAGFESLDIYRCVKPYKKFFGLERMNQTSVERFLGIERRDKMNGGMLIPYYFEYERTGDAECERLLLLHNNDDVRGMLKLCDMLAYPDIFSGKFAVRNAARPAEIFQNTCILEYDLESPVPVPVLYDSSAVQGGKCSPEGAAPGLMIAAEGSLLQINVGIYEGTARIPLANVEDYYYLPAEDRVIHKDVAEFVDRKFRRKATKKNCFLKKDGRFIPAFGMEAAQGESCGGQQGTFYIPDKRGKLMPYIEAGRIEEASAEQIYRFALMILKNL